MENSDLVSSNVKLSNKRSNLSHLSKSKQKY